MFLKFNVFTWANRSRTSVALSRETRSKRWFGYTNKTHLRGFKTLDFSLVRVGRLPCGFSEGVCLCSSELYSPNTFKTSSHQNKGNSWQLNLASSLVCSGALALSINIIVANSAFAQSVITPDQNLGSEQSQVIKNYNGNSTEAVTGGATRGHNLFHSFLEFNISEGRSALFLSPNSSIQNILVRVTGNNHSEILGNLETAGFHPNLFLINPNGIVFGPNARLNVGGSFVASTASGIQFADGTIFSSISPQTVPLLTVSVPIGLQFGRAGGDINVQGTLQVPKDETLALVGGNITLDGGNVGFLKRNTLQAESGQIALAGILGVGIIGLNFDSNKDINNQIFTFPDDVALADVSLKNQARVDVSGQGAGYIQIHGRRVTSTTSQVVADSTGSQSSRGIFIQAEQLSLKDGSQVTASVTGEDSTGSGGSIKIVATDSLQVIGTVPQGLENAGNPSALFTLTEGDGSGGAITIQTGKLIVEDGGNISASTRGSDRRGDGGTIKVTASDFVKLSGTTNDSDELPSGLFTQTRGIGNAGSLMVKTPMLIVQNGAVVSASTRQDSQGNGGSITIQASNFVKVIGTSASGEFPSGLFARSRGSGNAGSLLINTGELIVRDRAEVTVGALGTGNAGKLEITAREVRLDRQGKLFAQTTLGDGGDINLQLQNFLLLRNNSQISTSAGTDAAGGGNGGNITINIPNGFIVAAPNENSNISADAFGGTGGNVQINAFGVYGIQFRDKDNPQTSDITASSEFGLNGTVEIDTPNVDLNQGLINLQTQPVEPKLAQVCQGRAGRNQDTFTVTGRGGLPANPTESLNADAVIADWIALDSVSKVPSNADIGKNSTRTHTSILEATGWSINAKGEIVLTNAPSVTLPNSWQKSNDCNVIKASS